MASVTNKLVLDFKATGKEDTIRMSYNYAQANATGQAVKALGAAIVTNGSIFKYPPTELVAAKIVTTTETDYDLS